MYRSHANIRRMCLRTNFDECLYRIRTFVRVCTLSSIWRNNGLQLREREELFCPMTSIDDIYCQYCLNLSWALCSWGTDIKYGRSKDLAKTHPWSQTIPPLMDNVFSFQHRPLQVLLAVTHQHSSQRHNMMIDASIVQFHRHNYMKIST